MSDNIVVQLQDICKTYHMGGETIHALQNVSLSFQQGSFWAILGHSGSGKSTLLNVLGCLDVVNSGSYILDGIDVSQLDDEALSDIRLRKLGFIFQSFNLINQLTVQENIALPLYYLGWDADESAERAAEIAHVVGLEGRLGHRPSQLSGGQQQRVAIARALANNPSIILADEPTGNLDSATGHAIMDLLFSLHDQGTTILMVTHTPEVAERIPNAVMMKDGQVDNITTNRIEKAGTFNGH